MERFGGVIIKIIFISAIFFSFNLYAQPGGTPPGHGGTPPGHGGTPPGQGGGKPGNPCPGPPGTPCPQIPISGGLEFLIVAGMIIGVRKLYKSNKIGR